MRDRSVIDGPVQPSVRLGSKLDHRLDARFVSNVDSGRDGLPTLRGDLVGDGPAAFLVEIGYEHLGTFHPKALADRGSDTASSTGDEEDLVREKLERFGSR